MSKFLFGGAATIALMSGSALLAQAEPPAQPMRPGHKMMMQTELRTEVPGHVQKMFARLDTNRDGFIDKAELDAMQAQHAAKVEQRAEKRAARFDPARMFARLDANKDGKITQAEADAAHNARAQAKGGQPAKTHADTFARLDTNKDGVVTRTEFDAAAAQMHARMEQMHGRMEQAGMHRGFASHMFEAADLNKDGRVSQAEMQQMALQHFDQADLNHDGKLSPDERKQSRQAFRAQHKA